MFFITAGRMMAVIFISNIRVSILAWGIAVSRYLTFLPMATSQWIIDI